MDRTTSGVGAALCGLAVLLSVLLADVVAEAGLYLLKQRGIRYDPIPAEIRTSATANFQRSLREPTYLRHDPDLGWAIRLDGLHPSGLYHVTTDGLRAPSPPSDIVAFGDSYTHGDEVPDSAAWAAMIGARNYGVPAYGLDQAWLRYRQERPRARLVLIGYMSENIARHVSAYRPFYWFGHGAVPFSKPRFRLDGDSLVLLPNPIRSPDDYADLDLNRLGASDLHWQTRAHASRWDRLAIVRLVKLALAEARRVNLYDPSGEPFRLTVAILDAFARDVQAAGSEPVVLLFPARWELPGLPYRGMADTLRSHGHRVLDLADLTHGCGRCDSLFAESHFNEQGNALVASYLRSRLHLAIPVDRGDAAIPGLVTPAPSRAPPATDGSGRWHR